MAQTIVPNTLSLAMIIGIHARSDLLLETLNHRHTSFVDRVSLLDSDVGRHVPGDLSQCADHALIRPLGASLGE